MKYKLNTNKNIKEIIYFNYSLEGFTIKTKNHGRKNIISANKITFVDTKIINLYIKIRLSKKLEKMFKEIFFIINNESDDSSSDVKIALGEIEKLKGIINKKYANYLEIEECDKIMNKIIVLEEELKRKLISILYIENNELVNNNQKIK